MNLITYLSTTNLDFLKNFINWYKKSDNPTLFLKATERFQLFSFAEYLHDECNIGVTFDNTGYIIFHVDISNIKSKDLDSAIIKEELNLKKVSYFDAFKRVMLEAIKIYINPF